jgi:hypothetical protein
MLSAKYMLSAKHRVKDGAHMKKTEKSIQTEMRVARQTWPDLGPSRLRYLRSLLVRYKFSVALGEITRIDNRWYVTHTGLLQLASRRQCRGIKTALQERLCDPATSRWVFRAVVYKSSASMGFVGYGDADPSNVSLMMQGAEMRVAETRAVNRALRKAYGIGLCSIEELGPRSASFSPAREPEPSLKQQPKNGSNDGAPYLRDKLCLLIREHRLDPNLVKAYAADFCGTQTLRDANRDQIEAFVSRLFNEAKENRDGLVCKLNSYTQSLEVKS